MKRLNPHYSDVLRFWRAVEAFNLPDMPETRPRDGKYVTNFCPENMLPWEKKFFQHCDEGKKWKHTLYFGIVRKQAVIDMIRGLLMDPGMEPPEEMPGKTWMSALVLDESGRPYDRSYIRAAFSYGIDALIKGVSLDGINEELEKAYADYRVRFQVEETETEEEEKDDEEEDDEEDYEEEYEEDDEKEEEAQGNPVTWGELEKELDDLHELLSDLFKVGIPVCCISERIAADKTPEAPFLNSFYTGDLNRLISYVEEEKDICPSLATYLKPGISLEARKNMQRQDMMLQCLNPVFQSPARWPSDPAHGLYAAQQAAVNVTLHDLKRGVHLLGINGPPGTGKTTLLRDIVADIVLGRAKRLLNCDVKKIFATKRTEIGPAGYYDIDWSVFGNDGILIASNNNNAVENISRELPLRKNIDRESFPDAAYFPWVAGSVVGDGDCWGMLSAVLGNAFNCSNFTNKFWYKPKFGSYLYDQASYHNGRKHLGNYEQTAAELRDLLAEYDEFSKIAETYHTEIIKRLLPGLYKGRYSASRYKDLREQLLTSYGIKPENMIDERFLDIPMAEIHRITPYASEKINTLRSRIFLKSLELHECAMLVNAKCFRANIDMFLNMLAGKHAELLGEADISVLWSSFFFCVPVVSTTLASIERLFRKMGSRSVGWLLLDEAGQATPQSACGAIWRSERCIIIGDTLQVPPVVTIPPGLGKLLQNNYGITENCWSPVYYSTQSLADRITELGTYVPGNSDDIWTGLPLRAHRRCDEPMFSIANKIAYDGQMVKVTPGSKKNDSCLGPSCWIDVTGKKASGHVITEEITVLYEMIDRLFAAGDERSIYVIAPFKSVAHECQVELDKHFDEIPCGTIHTFQGKEADIVFIVLGGDPAVARAREWVAQTPNMLNVAITRAKKYVYVIGNRTLWAGHKYFDHLAEKLPVKSYPGVSRFTY